MPFCNLRSPDKVSQIEADTPYGFPHTATRRDMSEQEPRRRIEREYGVPFPGEILERTLWTQTALKRLPAAGGLQWRSLFGRTAPVIVDVGCGNGRYLIGSAIWRPQADHLGVDALPVVIRYATRRANQRGLRNIRFAVIGGKELLADHVPVRSVSEIHCYHPQPYGDPSEHGKRLITPEFLFLAWRALVPGGLFVLQTDHPAYWGYAREVVPAWFDWRQQSGRWPDAPKGRTRREIVALRSGLPVFRAICHARTDLTPEQALSQVSQLPPPTFDATR